MLTGWITRLVAGAMETTVAEGSDLIMRNYRAFAMSFVLAWAMAGGVPGEERDAKSDSTPVIARSGDIEVSSIKIIREKASDAAKGADLTNMQLELWLTRKWSQDAPRSYLVKILELAPIEDNTG